MTEEQNKNQLPKDWKWVKLGDIVSSLGDGLHGTPKYSDTGDYHFINGNNLSNGSIKIKDKTKKVEKSEYEKYKKPLGSNTILVSINGTLGNIAFYKNEKVILGKSACYLNLIEDVSKHFISLFLSGNTFLNYANRTATGTTIKNVSLKAMRDFQVPLPPKTTQQSIVSKIEELFSELDKGIEQLKKAQQQLKTYRQSVLKWAFEGKLTEEWREQQQLSNSKDLIVEIHKKREVEFNRKVEYWKKQKLKSELETSKPQRPSNLDVKNELLEGLIKQESIPASWALIPLVFVSDNYPNSIVDGPFGSSINVNEDYIETGVPVIRMVNIRPFKFVGTQMKFIKESKFLSLKRHNILPEDILIAKVGATIGDCCIYPKNQPEGMLSTTGSCRVRLDKEVMNVKFLEYYIFFHRTTLKDIASQTAQPFLNMKVLKSFPVVLPTLEEQNTIVEEIESRLSVADKMEENITQSLQQSEALRQSILKKAFDGRLL